MLHMLARNWWALALRGLVAVIFGLLTIALPGITLVTLVLLFGAYALVDGVFNVIAVFRTPSHHWALLIEGVTGRGCTSHSIMSSRMLPGAMRPCWKKYATK